jgi:predicted RNA-binding protein Jag
MIDEVKEFIGETRESALQGAMAHFGVGEDRLEVYAIPSDLTVSGLGARVLLLVGPKAIGSELGEVGTFVRGMLETLGFDRGLRIEEREEDGKIVVRVQSAQLDEAERKIGGVEGALAHLADRMAQTAIDEDTAATVVLTRAERSSRDAGRRRGSGDRDRERGGRDRGERSDRGRERGRDRDRGDRGGDRDRGGERRPAGGDAGAAREAELEGVARKAAEEVQRTGEERFLGPMSSRERWVIHNTVKDISGVTSESVGDGSHKRVRIARD